MVATVVLAAPAVRQVLPLYPVEQAATAVAGSSAAMVATAAQPQQKVAMRPAGPGVPAGLVVAAMAVTAVPEVMRHRTQLSPSVERVVPAVPQ
jgi:hypothetical protein